MKLEGISKYGRRFCQLSGSESWRAAALGHQGSQKSPDGIASVHPEQTEPELKNENDDFTRFYLKSYRDIQL